MTIHIEDLDTLDFSDVTTGGILRTYPSGRNPARGVFDSVGYNGKCAGAGAKGSCVPHQRHRA